jgi:NAD(P)-dependent dehydrogenase (short-subunit alcohol dehydrogenase family)
LITGGVGELGQTLARHLVAAHGVRHLVLTSRRGPAAPEAEQLAASLKELGALSVVLAACDVSERAELERVLSAIDPAHPLTGVFHLAGVLDDGVVTELNAERLSRVLRPKVDGAIHLHLLTQGMDLAAFVLFSSSSGVLGGAGQASYAAANAVLDALAAERRSRGLAGQSLAWGLWQPEGAGMAAGLAGAHRARLHRLGMRPLSQQHALALFDAASGLPEALLVPMRIDLGQLERELSRWGSAPPMLRSLIRPALRAEKAVPSRAAALRQRIAPMSQAERFAFVLGLVQDTVATVLGFAGRAAVPATQPLMDLGLDSLMVVEVRNRLAAAVEKRLPATLLLDSPTPHHLASLLLEILDVERSATLPDADVRAKLGRVSLEALRQLGVLETIMAQPDAPEDAGQDPSAGDVQGILAAEHDSLIEIAERMLTPG